MASDHKVVDKLVHSSSEWTKTSDSKGNTVYTGYCKLCKKTVTIDKATYKVVAKSKIVYKANGGKGKTKSTTIGKDGKLTVAKNKFKKSGYVFAGWNTKANGKGKTYKAKAKITAKGKTVKLYAIWKKK